MEMNENTKRFLGILSKIPMFQRLLPVQAMEILKICKAQSFDHADILMEYGSKSIEMFILLAGELNVRSADGKDLATLKPITSVGEMGIITGQPRTATVVANGKVSVFLLSKIKFEVLLKKFPDIGFVIFRNTINTLSARLSDTNEQLAESQREIEQLKSDALLASP